MNDQVSISFFVRVIVRKLLLVFGLFFWLRYTKGHMCIFFSNVYSISVAVDVSDFADSDLVGLWIRKKLFVGHVLMSRGYFVGTSFGRWDLFWVVIDF